MFIDPLNQPGDIATGPYRAAFHLAKYHNDRTPDDGEPDEVIVVSQWFYGNGMPIDDNPELVARLEAENPLEGVASG